MNREVTEIESPPKVDFHATQQPSKCRGLVFPVGPEPGQRGSQFNIGSGLRHGSSLSASGRAKVYAPSPGFLVGESRDYAFIPFDLGSASAHRLAWTMFFSYAFN
jgi:hypothetical protein